MAENDTSGGSSHAAGRFNVFTVLQAHDLAAYHAGDGQPADHCQGDKEVHDIASENGHEDDDQQHVRQAVHNVDKAHEEEVHLASCIPGDGTQDDSDDDAGDGSDQTDGDGDLSSVDDAAQHVAAAVVGSQEILAFMFFSGGNFGGKLIIHLDLAVDGELGPAFADLLAKLALGVAGDRGFNFAKEVGLSHGENPLLPEGVHLDLEVCLILLCTQVGGGSLQVVEHLVANFIPGLLLDDGNVNVKQVCVDGFYLDEIHTGKIVHLLGGGIGPQDLVDADQEFSVDLLLQPVDGSLVGAAERERTCRLLAFALCIAEVPHLVGFVCCNPCLDLGGLLFGYFQGSCSPSLEIQVLKLGLHHQVAGILGK
ncbi:hypothetical protein SDC9_67660 [bioreactor metagenome]|uniref:Uncharacterized protein n=1 Tax=bioreactor metagenome TaxID=1076179 RepID=A0A644XZ89_9ZZZZ